MTLRDPVDKIMLRMEERRFATRSDGQISLIERADTLREVSRLASSMTLPYALSASDAARDSLRLLHMRAEDRARELIQEQLQQYLRAEEFSREKYRRAMIDAWANLTGPLGHLRAWAQSKLQVARQQLD
jgi:hypothetical protein